MAEIKREDKLINGGNLDRMLRHIKAYTDKKVVIKDSNLEFPLIGSNDSIYVGSKEKTIYYWDEEQTRYIVSSRDWENIDEVQGGNALE